MTDTLVVTARVDDDTKDKAAKVLAELGLTVADAVRLMMLHIANEGELPFSDSIPNAETIEAMEEARRGGMKSFNTVEELFADLNAED